MVRERFVYSTRTQTKPPDRRMGSEKERINIIENREKEWAIRTDVFKTIR